MRILPKPRSSRQKASSKQPKEQLLPVVKLEIVSDVVCPFCYLVRHRIHQAMEQFEGKLDFELHWLAYQLQPLAPPEGVPIQVFMQQKFKGQAQYLLQKKQAFFKNEGLEYTGDGVIGNTFNAHRLLAYAGKQSLVKQDEVMGLLFKAFFAKAQNINEADVLRSISREAKLDNPDKVVDDPLCCADEVQHELENMYRDVVGVPHTVINGDIRLGGAQDTIVYIKVFQQLLDESTMGFNGLASAKS